MVKQRTTGRPKADDDEFDRALDELESTLETPVVPGELASWIEAVQRSTSGVACQLKQQYDVVHQQEFDEMAAEGGDLSSRIEQLKEGDAELLSGFGRFSTEVARCQESVVEGDKHETELDTAHDNLVEKGLAFVIQARTQETAIATWYSEAFLRDHGVGD